MAHYNVTNEQIKKCYDNPELLKELFPNAFKPVLEAGKWYSIKLPDGRKALFNFSGKYDEFSRPTGYGIGYDGKWKYIYSIGWDFSEIQQATIEEVEKALINEAVKRGYESSNHICLYNNSRLETDNIYSYNAPYNLLNLGSKCASVVFVDGKWAEIIQETELELTLDQIAEKFGVDKVKIKK